MLRRLLMALDKPQYLLQPSRIVGRLRPGHGPRGAGAEVVLPWGMQLRVRRDDPAGDAICGSGVYELALSEVLWRLTDPGEVACDVGGNVGYMSALLASRVGSSGQVVAFEPHPELSAALASNALRWRDLPGVGRVEVIPAAVGAAGGEGTLCVPAAFVENSGLAFLRSEARPAAAHDTTLAVRIVRLDAALAGVRRPVVLKVDVEGGELEVFQGAGDLLDPGGIRDVAFEDHGEPPSPAMRLLATKGFTLFRIDRSFFGPRLRPPAGSRPRHVWEPPNYLATRDPERARARLRPRGWRLLNGTRAT